MTTLLIAVAALIAVGVGAALFASADTVSPRRAAGAIFGADDIGRKVGMAITAMTSGPDDRVRQVIDSLRSDDRAAAEIARAYAAVPVESYDLRWTLTNLAATLGQPASLALFQEVCREPIPQERARDTHRLPTVTRELMIRVRALEGVRTLAVAGHAAARTFLMDQLKSEHFSIRKAAALGLLGMEDGAAFRDRIAAALPKEESFVLDLREAKVEDLGVIRHAAATARAVSPAPRLSGAGEPPEKGPRRAKGPPTI